MKSQTLLLISLVVILFPFAIFSQTDLIPFDGNPVLIMGEPGTWEGDGVYSASVLYEGGIYKMWYVGADGTPDGTGIGYATSRNGVEWTKYEENPVLKGNPGEWDHHTPGVCVIKLNDKYTMYYTGALTGRSSSHIGLAYSEDGIFWIKFEKNPILSPGEAGEWDSYNVADPYVMYRDNEFKMWYGGHSDRFRIGYATSVDGENWDKYDGNPVVDLGNSNDFDRTHVAGPSVLWDGKHYLMYYFGNYGIGIAYSDNGTDWIKSEENPILTGNSIMLPNVLLMGNCYKVWYSSYDFFGKVTISYAEDLPDIINVCLDIKPGSCPNPLNLKSNGMLPVAILGTDALSVQDIETSTITLQGVSPLRYAYEDVSKPLVDPISECDCHEDGPDGYEDITLKFETQAIVETLGDVNDGDQILLTLKGNLLDGTEIEGHDCVLIHKKDEKLKKELTQEMNQRTPLEYSLKYNYPNPFNPLTTIHFVLPEAQKVTLTIYNTKGERVKRLVNDMFSPGQHLVIWDGMTDMGSSVPSGLYFCRMQAGLFHYTISMLLLR